MRGVSLFWSIFPGACAPLGGVGEYRPQSHPVQSGDTVQAGHWVGIEQDVEKVGNADVVLFGQSTLSGDLLGQLDYLWYSYASASFYSSPAWFSMIPEWGDYCVVASGPFARPDRDVGSSIAFSLDGRGHTLRRESDGVETSYSWYGPIVEATDGSEHQESVISFDELGIGGRFPPVPAVEDAEGTLESLEDSGVLHLTWVAAEAAPGVMMGLSLWPYSYTDGSRQTSGVLWCQFEDDGEAIVDVRSIWPTYTVHQLDFSRTEYTQRVSEQWGDVVLWLYSDQEYLYRRRVRLQAPDSHP